MKIERKEISFVFAKHCYVVFGEAIQLRERERERERVREGRELHWVAGRERFVLLMKLLDLLTVR